MSEKLASDVLHWSDRHEAAYDSGYPPGSGFQSEDEWHAFEREGWALARRLRDELGPETRVEYFLPWTRRLVSVVSFASLGV